MKYVVAGNAVSDCITLPDGTCTGFVPGGATLFALLGIQLWTDEVILCGGFGADYKEKLGDWLERNGIDQRGFNVRDENNPLNYMYYRDEGGWDSETVYGKDHFDRLDCNPEEDHLEEFVRDAKGLAVFRGRDPEFYREVFQLREKYLFKLGWEIKGDFAVPEYIDEIKALLANVDSFSINQPETYRLFGVDSDEKALDALKKLRLPLVIYRVGKKGIYIIKDGESFFAPAFTKYPVKDVTGCGNSSTSAAFYAWCEGKRIEEIAAYANVTAAHNLRYYGAMELTEEDKTAAREEVRQMTEELLSTKQSLTNGAG